MSAATSARILVLLFALPCLMAQMWDPTKIIVTNPGLGDQLTLGDPITITWAGGKIWPMWIKLYDVGTDQFVLTIAANVPNTGNYGWSVTAPYTGIYRVFVHGNPRGLDSRWDYSDDFHIFVPTPVPTKVPTVVPTKVPTREPTKIPTREPTKVPTPEPTKIPVAWTNIAMVYPNGGETFAVAAPVNVLWTGGAGPWKINVVVKQWSNGAVVKTLMNQGVNTGSVLWTVDVPAGQYVVRVSEMNDLSWDTTPMFTVVAPPTPIPTPPPPTPVFSPGGCSNINGATELTCPAYCKWDCALNLCYDPNCAGFTNNVDCLAVPGCFWHNALGKCRDHNVNFNIVPNCALASSEQVCGGNCQWTPYQGLCVEGTSSQACAWSAQKDATKCPTHRCYFSPLIGYCYDTTCPAKLNSVDCIAQSGCAWENGFCADYDLVYGLFPCSQSREVADCPSTKCHWDGTQCLTGAGAHVILPPAPHNGGCAWIPNPTAATCPAGCTFDSAVYLCYDARCTLLHTPNACNAISGCTWSRNQCRDYNLHYGSIVCSKSLSPLTCGGNSCEWSYKQGKCIAVSPYVACPWVTQNSAASCPDRCSYDNTLGFCYESHCLSATSECACDELATSGCLWLNGRCLDYNVQTQNYACSSATNENLCGKNCMWNGNACS